MTSRNDFAPRPGQTSPYLGRGSQSSGGLFLALVVGDQLIPHVFAHMIRRFPWGTTAAAAAGYLGTTVGIPASASAAR